MNAKANERGFVHILGLALLLIVLGVGFYFVNKSNQSNQVLSFSGSNTAYAVSKETNSCSGAKGLSYDGSCKNGNFRYVKFLCPDGTSNHLGGPSSCKSTIDWKTAANISCQTHSTCR